MELVFGFTHWYNYLFIAPAVFDGVSCADPVPAGPLDPAQLIPIIKAVTKSESLGIAHTLGDAPLTLQAALDALYSLEHPLNKCRQYHIRKALVRPLLSPPVVISRGVTSLTLSLEPWHPLYDVHPSHLVVEVDGAPLHHVEVPADYAARKALAPVPCVIDGLARGTSYTLRLLAGVTDPLLAATLAPSASVAVRTLDPPRAPPAPLITECTLSALCVRVMNMGLECDPPVTGAVLEVDGVVWTGAGVVTEDRNSIEYVVDGLREGSKHTLRCRCAVEDVMVDATLPWSEAVSARTDVDMVRNHSTMGQGLDFFGNCWVMGPVMCATELTLGPDQLS